MVCWWVSVAVVRLKCDGGAIAVLRVFIAAATTARERHWAWLVKQIGRVTVATQILPQHRVD